MSYSINTGSAYLMGKLCCKNPSSTIHVNMAKMPKFVLCGFFHSKIFFKPDDSFVQMKVLNQSISNHSLLVLNRVIKTTCVHSLICVLLKNINNTLKNKILLSDHQMSTKCLSFSIRYCIQAR